MNLRHGVLGTVAIALTLTAGVAVYTVSQVQAQSTTARSKTFQIEYTNLTTGQTFSPAAFVTHNRDVRLWQLNTRASFGLMRLAEEGNPGPLFSAVVVPNLGKQFGMARIRVSALPGQTRSVQITATEEYPLLSAAWMLVMTNDGFTGLNSINLMEINQARTFELIGYEAGTERNNEQRPFLIAFEGTNRAPENGLIEKHPGIRGNADAPAAWDFKNPVARVTIKPIQAN